MITRIKWKGHEHEWNFSRWYVIYTHHNRNINNKYHKYTSWVCLCVFTSKSHLIKCYVVRRFVAEMYDCYFLLLLFVCMFVTPQSNVKLIYKMHKGFKYIWTIKDWQEKKNEKGAKYKCLVSHKSIYSYYNSCCCSVLWFQYVFCEWELVQ